MFRFQGEAECRTDIPVRPGASRRSKHTKVEYGQAGMPVLQRWKAPEPRNHIIGGRPPFLILQLRPKTNTISELSAEYADVLSSPQVGSERRYPW